MKAQVKWLLIVGVSALALSGCSTAHHAIHWEYKIVPSGNYSLNSTPPPDWPAKQEAMLDSLGEVFNPTWSPNGRVIQFFRTSQGAGGKASVWQVDLTGRNVRKIPTPVDGSDPTWGPLLP